MPGAGPHRPHAGAHLHARRPACRRDLVEHQAAKADEDYIAQCRAQGLYPLGYYPHNLHFIWMGATASGQGSSRSTRRTSASAAIPNEALGSHPASCRASSSCRTGRWCGSADGTTSSPIQGPRHDTLFTRGAWRYARAMALTATGRLAEAEPELGQLQVIVEDPALKGQATFSSNTGYAIAAHRARSRRRRDRREAEGLGRGDRCTSIARSATRTRLIYQEPPDWHAPVRQNLGAVLLEAGRADEAEAVYWEDLRKNPEQRLVALRAAPGAQGAGQGGRRGARRGALQQGVEGFGREAERVADRQLAGGANEKGRARAAAGSCRRTRSTIRSGRSGRPRAETGSRTVRPGQRSSPSTGRTTSLRRPT